MADFSSIGGTPVQQDSYDFSSVGGTPVNPEMGGKPPLGFVISKVLGTAPWNTVNAMYKGAIGNEAEFLGKHTPNWIPPQAIAAATLPAAMLPEIIGAVSGTEGLDNSTNPIVKGLMNTPEELSPEYDALLQNPSLNISQRTPELGGAKATFPNPYTNPLSTKPPLAIQTETTYPTNLRGAEPLPSTVPLKYPGQADNPRAFLNFANARLKAFGDKLSPQEVTDYGKIISQYYKDGVFPKGSPLAVDGAKLSAKVDDLQNTLIPGRENVDVAYGIAKTQQAVKDFITKIPLYVAEAGGGLYGLKQALKYVSGNQ